MVSESENLSYKHSIADLSQAAMGLLLLSNYREVGLERMGMHVSEFEAKYGSVGKLPRNHIWRPFRFCVRDVVLGLVVVRHSLEYNCLEVDVCLTSDVPEYELGSGARMTAAFLLSEAYKCGGTMEIRFSEYVEGGRVPAALVQLAQELGLKLGHVERGHISASEARQLYILLTGFPHDLHQQINYLADLGRLAPERVCYTIHRGIWTLSEVESLVFGSSLPDTIFSGEIMPEQRTLYLQATIHARAAIMGRLLESKLARRERSDGITAVDLEDDMVRLATQFYPSYYAKSYICDEDIKLPWLGEADAAPTLEAGQQLIALIRGRDSLDLNLHLAQDISVGSKLAQAASSGSGSSRVCILIPRDFDELSAEKRERMRAKASEGGVSLMVCPEPVAVLDVDAAKRFANSRIMRQ